MWELLILAPGLAYGIVFAIFYLRTKAPARARTEYALQRGQRSVQMSATPTRKMIPAAIRDEIDQTHDWWERQFHRLLGETGEFQLEYGEIEYYEERTLAGQVVWNTRARPVAYLSCPCQPCRTTRRMGCDPRD